MHSRLIRAVVGLLGGAVCLTGCASWNERADAKYREAKAREGSQQLAKGEDPYDGWLFNRVTGRTPETVEEEVAADTPTAPGATQATFQQPAQEPLPSTPSPEVAGYDSLPGDSLENRRPEPEGIDRFKLSNLSDRFKNSVGLGPDRALAQLQFKEAEDLFNAKQFKEAAGRYKKAGKRWPDSGLEEDAMYMRAESLFFADRYPTAHEVYGELVKKYPNTRHLNKIVARQFSIARYWQQHSEADPHWAIRPNWTDRSRPFFDTAGNALEAYDQVRLNDPRGQLADDATMAAANGFFLKGRFEDADFYYALLRKDYPKSEHQLQAHLLGLQCKLRMYQGSGYDETPLLGAEELIDQMLTQFPSELGSERERLLLAKKEVRAQRAERDFQIAQFYDKSDHYQAARYYYADIVKEYPNSSFAEQSKERLAQIQAEPGTPPDRLAWMDKIFDPNSIDQAIAAENAKTVKR